MAHPAIIRTDFATAEDAARAYGVPLSRVKKIQKALLQSSGPVRKSKSIGAKKKSFVRESWPMPNC